jgi:hypothetical protein
MGLKRTCIRYVKSPVGWRCSVFAKASKVGRHPYCPKGKLKARDPRGKSPGLVRKRYCTSRRK